MEVFGLGGGEGQGRVGGVAVVAGQAEGDGEVAVVGAVEGACGGALDRPGHEVCSFSSRCRDSLNSGEESQTTVILGDLAAVEAAANSPEAACRYALRALDQLERTWYATGMDRVREVRRALVPHQHKQCVRELDDRLYGWSTTVSALAR
ncbi:hypothetical protein QFZ49_002558 [Streptomyces turgidiscabies]|uniref:Uncharacterized protein n=1 Tax=Streptomyces turgidiscabies TaxID=85558 RepID=A0ABU0RLM6_9ACTN|nr:hypothetical protein [Streptomyces turgidiscabies]